MCSKGYVQAKSTGQLSAVAFVANVLGCMARIFTSYQDGAGMAMIRGFVLGKLIQCRHLYFLKFHIALVSPFPLRQKPMNRSGIIPY